VKLIRYAPSAMCLLLLTLNVGYAAAFSMDDRATGEVDATSAKAAVDKAADEKTSGEKTSGEKTAGEKATLEQTAAQPGAGSVVEQFHVALITAMKTEHFDARAQLLGLAVDKAFDIKRIASISVGRTWRTLSEEQRSVFIAVLRDLVVATYADRFSSFSGQRFETEAVKEVRAGTVVDTHLVRADGTKVSLNYALRYGRIFNIVADGVSDLSLRRADYNSIIKRDGFDDLLAHVQEKLRSLRVGAGVEASEDS